MVEAGSADSADDGIVSVVVVIIPDDENGLASLRLRADDKRGSKSASLRRWKSMLSDDIESKWEELMISYVSHSLDASPVGPRNRLRKGESKLEMAGFSQGLFKLPR
jgi:hypothetical protein